MQNVSDEQKKEQCQEIAARPYGERFMRSFYLRWPEFAPRSTRRAKEAERAKQAQPENVIEHCRNVLYATALMNITVACWRNFEGGQQCALTNGEWLVPAGKYYAQRKLSDSHLAGTSEAGPDMLAYNVEDATYVVPALGGKALELSLIHI